eukprot:31205-Pelagococcus_subviridis.AAC.15
MRCSRRAWHHTPPSDIVRVSAIVHPATRASPTFAPASSILSRVSTFAPSPIMIAALPPGRSEALTNASHCSCSRCHASLNARGSERSALLDPSYTSERQGGVERRQTELKGAEGGY